MLDSAYDPDKIEILHVLIHLLHNEAFSLQHEVIFQSALSAYRIGKVDFADYLLQAESESAGFQLFTFD